jgi:hypothetical protein
MMVKNEEQRKEAEGTILSILTFPVKYASNVIHESLPFTKKGAVVLLKVGLSRCGDEEPHHALCLRSVKALLRLY